MKQKLFIAILALCTLFANTQVPNFAWAKHVSGDGEDRASDVTADAAGNAILGGMFTNSVGVDFDPGPGVYNLNGLGQIGFLLKLDTAGNFVWARRVGNHGAVFLFSVATDAQNNVYAIGSFGAGTVDFDPGPGVYNLSTSNQANYILKLDAAGNFVWARAFETNNSVFNNVAGYDLGVDASLNVYSVGYFRGTIDFDPGSASYPLISAGYEDVYISKLDASGNFVWAKRIGGPYVDQAYAIKVDAPGNVYLTGCFNGTVDFDPGVTTYNLVSAVTGSISGMNLWGNVFACKLTAGGNLAWARSFASSNIGDGTAITIDNSGNSFIAGRFQGTTDFDPGANISTLTSNGLSDAYICKLDASGNYVWAKSVGGIDTEGFLSVATDSSGEVYATGYFSGGNDVDPGPGVYILPGFNWLTTVLLKLSSSGNFIWAGFLTEGPGDLRTSVYVDVVGYIYTTGTFRGTTDFDPTNNACILIPQLEDPYVQKLYYGHRPGPYPISDPNTVGIHKNTSTGLNVFPNPTSGVLRFNGEAKSIQGAIVEVVNTLGEISAVQTIGHDQESVDLSNLKAGIYFLKVSRGNELIISQKVIKD